jgi:PEP-CTERM motif
MRTGCMAIIGAVVLALMLPTAAQASPVLFEASGPNAASIQATVDGFRTAVGSPNNAGLNNPGPLASGRREIGWDFGAVFRVLTPSPLELEFSGALLTTGGTRFLLFQPIFETALTPLGFSTFSPPRVFTPVGSNVTDVTFFIPGPGSLEPATVSAFGAVFTDVDLLGPTMIELFGLGDVPLFSQSVLAGPTPTGSQSFLGVLFNSGELITRARITTGNTPIFFTGSDIDNPGGGVDVVAMDDFIYSEPQAVPEPSSLALLAFGAVCTSIARRRRNG